MSELAIIDLETGEITPLDEWLRDYRRQQLRLLLSQLGRGGRWPASPGAAGDIASELARALFAPPAEIQ